MKTLQINKLTNELTEMTNLTLSENYRIFAFIKEDVNCKGLVHIIPANTDDFNKFDNINSVNEIIDILNDEVVQFMDKKNNNKTLEDFIGSDANFFTNYLSNGNQLKVYLIDEEIFIIDNTLSLVWNSLKDYKSEEDFMKKNSSLDGHLRNNLLKLQPSVVF